MEEILKALEVKMNRKALIAGLSEVESKLGQLGDLYATTKEEAAELEEIKKLADALARKIANRMEMNM